MSRKQVGLKVTTDPQVGVTKRFFEALAYKGQEAALSELKDAALDSTGAPTPKTEAYINAGEWDAKDKMGLLFARRGTCFARIGVSSGGVTGSARFCGRVQCPTVSHRKGALVDAEEGNWYIQGGPRSTSGFFAEPLLPSAKNGGPIPANLEQEVGDLGTLELKLSLGQWKFLFDAWHEEQQLLRMLDEAMEVPSGDPYAGVETLSEESLVKVGREHKREEGGARTVYADAKSKAKPPSLKANPDALFKTPPEANLHQDLPEEMARERTESESDRVSGERELEAQMLALFARMDQRILSLEDRAASARRSAADSISEVFTLKATVLGLKGKVEALEGVVAELRDKEAERPDDGLLQRLEQAVLDPRGALAKVEHEMAGLATRFEFGSGIDFHNYKFASDQETATWFEGAQGKIALFADAVALLHSINATVVHTSESTRSKEAAKKIEVASELEASIIASFSTTLPSIFVGNQKDTQGGAYECLMGYLKTYGVWHPVGPHATSGLKNRIRDGTRVASTRLRTLQGVVTNNYELKEVATLLVGDSMAFIMELTEFVGQQYEELKETSSFSKEAAWSLIVDCVAHIFVELSEVRGAVVDAGQMRQGIFLWGMIRAWEIQERYRKNQFKNDPALTGLLVRRILVHDGEQSLKDQLGAIGEHGDQITALKSKVDMHHKEFASLQKKLKKAFPDKLE